MLPIIYFAIPSYVIMATIGLIIAIMYIYFKKDRIGLTYRNIIIYIVICAICGYIFSRLLFVIGVLPSLEKIDLNTIIHYLLHGGIVFYGGLFGVMIGIIITSIIIKKSSIDMLNFFAPAFPLFHSFARIGCLLAGCCYGIPYSWGIINAGEDFFRFPVQAVESICDILIFLIIVIVNRRRNNYKNSLELYLFLYSVCRFILEFYRGDSVRGIWISGISTAQFISLFIVTAVIIRRIVLIMISVKEKNI